MSMVDYSSDATHTPEPVKATTAPSAPIDKLVPDSELHAKVLEYVNKRIRYAERVMTQFHPRWNANEKKMQAYISLPDYELMLKQMTQTGAPPQPVSIIVPYAFATIWTIVTYLIHAFCGRKPIFQVSSYKEETVDNAQYMETMLQFNADHTRLILHLIQFFLDGEIYGMGAMRCLWDEEKAKRTVWTTQSPGGLVMPGQPSRMMRQTKTKTIYQGNKVQNIDPYYFFPDPRVPMAEVSRRGEFVFWRSFEAKHTLKRAESQGQLKNIDKIPKMSSNRASSSSVAGASQRSLISRGQAQPGDPAIRADYEVMDFYQIDQGTIEIIPKDLGLSDDSTPQKWLFSIANGLTIVQAEPFEYDHSRHPVVVIEPLSFGYAFGQPGTLDFLGPIQDTLSWFINSHIHNVRSALNNMFVVDPSMVEMQDLRNPGPGKIIRLKRSAYGQDVRAIVNQLQVNDVTGSHIQSMEVFLRMGDVLSAVNDNLRGVQDSGGRKTATEVRTSGEAGASRLAARARYISAQGTVDLAEQMTVNIQQFQDMDYYLQVVGAKGAQHPLKITPDMVAGDFWFPVNDGMLPIDRAALLGVWKEIFQAVIGNQQLSQRYDLDAIFEHIAELGGAKNLSQFKVQLGAGGPPPGGGVPVTLPGQRPPGGPAQNGGTNPALTGVQTVPAGPPQ